MLISKSPEAVASAVKQYIATKNYKVKKIYADDEIALRMQES